MAVVALLLLSLWFRYSASVQFQSQLQEFSALAQIGLRPYVGKVPPEQIAAHLTQLKFSSSLPLSALAVYNRYGELLASTVAVEPLPALLRIEFNERFLLSQTTDGRAIAWQPIAAELSFMGDPVQYYLVVQFDRSNNSEIWLWSSVLSALMLFFILLIHSIVLQRYFKKQHTGISAVQQWLGLLGQQQSLSPLTTTLQASLRPLKDSCDQLALQLEAKEQQAKNQLSELEQQCHALQHNEQQLSAELVKLQNTQHLQLQQLALRLSNIRQLWQEREKLDSFEYDTLLSFSILEVCVEFLTEAQHAPALDIPKALATAMASLTTMLPADINFECFEDNSCLTLMPRLEHDVFQLLLQALIYCGLRSTGATHLKLRIRLHKDTEQCLLHLQLDCDGDGLPENIITKMKAQPARLPWHQADLGLLSAMGQRPEAHLSLQSLEGLGCNISLSFALPVEPSPPSPLLPLLIIMDAEHERLTERKLLLNSLAAQTLYCTHFDELERLLHKHQPDVVLMHYSGQHQQIPLSIKSLLRKQPIIVYGTNAPDWSMPVSYHRCFCSGQLSYPLQQRFDKRTEKQLLVVDDSDTNLAFVKLVLKDKPLGITTASNGAEVLVLCQYEQFDLILLDIQLPDMSGVEIAQHLRQQSAYQHVPILAFTAHALPEEIDAFLAAGMNDIIVKPLDPLKLDALLREYQLLL